MRTDEFRRTQSGLFLVLHLEDAIERQVADGVDERGECIDVERLRVCTRSFSLFLCREMNLLPAVARGIRRSHLKSQSQRPRLGWSSPSSRTG